MDRSGIDVGLFSSVRGILASRGTRLATAARAERAQKDAQQFTRTVPCNLAADEHPVTAIMIDGHLKGFAGMCDRGAAEAAWRLGLPSCYGFYELWVNGAQGEYPVEAPELLETLCERTREIQHQRLRNRPYEPRRLLISRHVVVDYIEKYAPAEVNVLRHGQVVEIDGEIPTAYHFMTDTLTWAQGGGPGDPHVLAFLNKIPEAGLLALRGNE